MSKHPINVADLRREYMSAGLRRADLDSDPVVQFTHWFRQAQDAQLLDPNAMVVASVGHDGQPYPSNRRAIQFIVHISDKNLRCKSHFHP